VVVWLGAQAKRRELIGFALLLGLGLLAKLTTAALARRR